MCALRLASLSLVIALCGCNEYLPPATSPAALDPAMLTSMVGEAAHDNRVPATLLYAVLEIESGGDPKAMSRHGAMGLMQLMPATAAACGLRDPFDARGNLECGASYLATMLARFSGSIPLAIAAYNTGPSAVMRYHGIPPQTQLYVQRVLAVYESAGAAMAPNH